MARTISFDVIGDVMVVMMINIIYTSVMMTIFGDILFDFSSQQSACSEYFVLLMLI